MEWFAKYPRPGIPGHTLVLDILQIIPLPGHTLVLDSLRIIQLPGHTLVLDILRIIPLFVKNADYTKTNE